MEVQWVLVQAKWGLVLWVLEEVLWVLVEVLWVLEVECLPRQPAVEPSRQ